MALSVERIINELSRPQAYPHRVGEIEVLQTHISIVFLAEEILAARMQIFKAPSEVPAGMKMTLGHPGAMKRQVRKIYRRLLAAT